MLREASQKARIAVVGARGHVASALLPLLANHPRMTLAVAASRSAVGQPVPHFDGVTFVDADPALCAQWAAHEAIDAWILALPNGEAHRYVAAIDAVEQKTQNNQRQSVIVDLSADYRFDDTEQGWVYGLPEHFRKNLRGARRIANPGCYATGMQMALRPFLDVIDGPAHIFGVSGYSGAGTSPSPRNNPEMLRDNLMPYSLVGHVHEREVSRHLQHPVRFFPHVAAFFRGISLTISFDLLPTFGSNAAEVLYERLLRTYADEPLVTVQREIPWVRDNAERHGVTLGGLHVCPTEDGRAMRAVIVATLDNLLKGAATQAIQNLNLALGFDERLGILP